MTELERMLLDTQKEYARDNKVKDKIIVLLIICMLLEAIVSFTCFTWYESQFETTVTDKYTTEDVSINSEGDKAKAEYNNVGGDQYNDKAVHNDGKQDK